MKIMHLVPAMQSGGVEQVVIELSKELSSRGHANSVVSAGGRLVEELASNGSRHITMPIGKKSLTTLFNVNKLRKLIIHERPDVLHMHSRVPAWVGYLAWKKLPHDQRPALISTIHGFYSVNAYSAIMCKAEHIIAVSESAKQYVLSNYPATSDDKITVIPNSVDASSHHRGYAPSSEWTRAWFRQYPELQDKFTLCLPGRITRIKGHLDLIPILNKLIKQGIPAHAVIVGEASKSKQKYLHRLHQAFEYAGLKEHVSWVGHRSDLRDVMCACSVVLSLTHVPESFGKTTLEALALGRPTLGYAHGGVQEQLKAILPDGLIPVNNPAAAAQKLIAWHQSSPPEPAPIPAQYTIGAMIDSHEQLYSSAIRHPSHSV